MWYSKCPNSQGSITLHMTVMTHLWLTTWTVSLVRLLPRLTAALSRAVYTVLKPEQRKYIGLDIYKTIINIHYQKTDTAFNNLQERFCCWAARKILKTFTQNRSSVNTISARNSSNWRVRQRPTTAWYLSDIWPQGWRSTDKVTQPYKVT